MDGFLAFISKLGFSVSNLSFYQVPALQTHWDTQW